VPLPLQRFPQDARPEQPKADDRAGADHDHGREQGGPLKAPTEPPHDEGNRREAAGCGDRVDLQAHRSQRNAGVILAPVVETNYSSGEDFEIEFLSYRFTFNRSDFEERVTAAAVKLGLLEANELDDDETADLVELAARGWIEEPRSSLGRYLVRHWERISLVEGESLVYWLRKLIFRGAWLDHRVKEGLLEVAWDDDQSEFGYRDPRGGRALLELAPVPSWHELQFRG
jgi:hypothetical protein